MREDGEDWQHDEWIDVFRARGAWDITPQRAVAWLDANATFFAMASRHVRDGGHVLELGCGPGRHAIALALHGFRATGIDQNPVIVAQAQRNALACGVEDRTSFLVGDMNELSAFGDLGLSAVTHGGVMEHLPSKEAVQESVSLQLAVAPLVIFDVPVGSPKNLLLFARDTIFRQEWGPNEWVHDVLAPFEVLEWHIEEHDAAFMTDDLVVTLRPRR